MAFAARIVAGSLWRRRERVGIALAAVTLGLSVASALVLVSRDVERMVSRELRAYGPNVVVAPRATRGRAGVRDVTLASVSSRPTLARPAPGWAAPMTGTLGPVRVESELPLFYGTARAAPDAMKWRTVLVAGTDPRALAELHAGWRWNSGPPAATGRVPIWIGADAAREVGVGAGDTLSFLPLSSGGSPVAAQVAATFEAGGSEDGMLYLPLRASERLLGETGRVSVLLVRAAGAPAAIESAVASGWLAGPDREARVLRRMSAAEGSLLARLRALFGAVTLFALGAAALCTMSTLTDLALERRREVALLESLGASRREIVGLFLAEAAVLGLAGGVAGFAVGALAAQLVGQSVFHSSIRIDLSVLPALLVLALVITVLAGLPPVRHALAVEPARVLRGE